MCEREMEKKESQHSPPLLKHPGAQPSGYCDVPCTGADKASQIEFPTSANTLSDNVITLHRYQVVNQLRLILCYRPGRIPHHHSYHWAGGGGERNRHSEWRWRLVEQDRLTRTVQSPFSHFVIL